MTEIDVMDLTISEAASQVERRTLSPVELTDAMLRRIAAVDKVLNAYITVCGEQARQVAQAAEKMINAGYHLHAGHRATVRRGDAVPVRSRLPGRDQLAHARAETVTAGRAAAR
jgi:aspartyl-tRNA(Asn)/glutamyl-tRNA(Gln) amidotransferase subunit A